MRLIIHGHAVRLRKRSRSAASRGNPLSSSAVTLARSANTRFGNSFSRTFDLEAMACALHPATPASGTESGSPDTSQEVGMEPDHARRPATCLTVFESQPRQGCEPCKRRVHQVRCMQTCPGALRDVVSSTSHTAEDETNETTSPCVPKEGLAPPPSTQAQPPGLPRGGSLS